ncbi:MAG: hypothetical protein ACFBWO_12595 [Paracoccaceae bacterium]
MIGSWERRQGVEASGLALAQVATLGAAAARTPPVRVGLDEPVPIGDGGFGRSVVGHAGEAAIGTPTLDGGAFDREAVVARDLAVTPALPAPGRPATRALGRAGPACERVGRLALDDAPAPNAAVAFDG